MILSAFLILSITQDISDNEGCIDPQTDKDKKVCAYLNDIAKLEIKTVEKVAVGTVEEMLAIKPAAKQCGLINRVDPLFEEQVAVLEVINANEVSISCMNVWLANNASSNIFSDEKLVLLTTNLSVKEANICNNSQRQHQMNRCAYESFQAADINLNAQWKITYSYMKELDESQDEDGRIGYAEALLQAQRNWIVFRGSHCLSESYRFRGGSAEPLLRYNCLTSETKRRTEALAELVVEG